MSPNGDKLYLIRARQDTIALSVYNISNIQRPFIEAHLEPKVVGVIDYNFWDSYNIAISPDDDIAITYIQNNISHIEVLSVSDFTNRVDIIGKISVFGYIKKVSFSEDSKVLAALVDQFGTIKLMMRSCTPNASDRCIFIGGIPIENNFIGELKVQTEVAYITLDGFSLSLPGTVDNVEYRILIRFLSRCLKLV